MLHFAKTEFLLVLLFGEFRLVISPFGNQLWCQVKFLFRDCNYGISVGDHCLLIAEFIP